MPIDPVEGVLLEMPLVHYFGLMTPSVNVELYRVLAEMFQTLERHFAGNTEARPAGMVINTMGWVEGVGYELLHAIHTFQVNVVLVICQEYFYGIANELSSHSHTSRFSDLCVYRKAVGPQALRSALPIGAVPSASPLRLLPLVISVDLVHLVVDVSFAKEPDQIISSNVAGFIYITGF